MSKYLLLRSVAIMMAMASVGCSTSGEYRCESNDLCSSTSEWKYYSCSNDTGHCEKVDPLAIDPSTLPDATIGQSDYRVELTGTGGIPPYTFSLTRGNEEKLKWLTITPEGDDKAIFQNSIGTNNESLVPTDLNGGVPLTLTITLLDGSKHGTAVREDNQGKAFQMTIKVNDCNRDSCDNGDSTVTPIGTNRCSNGFIKTCNQDSLGCARWGGEDDCPTGVCQTEGLNAFILCCESQNSCGNSTLTRCEGGWIEVCSKDSTGCLIWKQDRECPNQTDCKPDGSSCKDCIDECPKSGDHQCASDNSLVNTCEINLATGCLSWVIYEQCTNDPTRHCLTTGCTNGQCTYRYTIQTNNVDGVSVEEVYDAQTNLYWKRRFESGTYTWAAANNQCSKSYHLPSVAYNGADPNKPELDTIIETGHGSPCINTCAFIDMPKCNFLFEPCFFWSSSIDAGYALRVAFYDGSINDGDKTLSHYVRCVRSGP